MKCNKFFKCNSEIAVWYAMHITLEIRQFKKRQNFPCLFQSKSAKISWRQNNLIYGIPRGGFRNGVEGRFTELAQQLSRCYWHHLHQLNKGLQLCKWNRSGLLIFLGADSGVGWRGDLLNLLSSYLDATGTTFINLISDRNSVSEIGEGFWYSNKFKDGLTQIFV